jgi:hypothetical protein
MPLPVQASGAAARGRLNWRLRLFVLKLTTYRLSSSNCSRPRRQSLHNCRKQGVSIYYAPFAIELALRFRPSRSKMPLGLSQEHAKSGLDRANSSHGRKRMTRFQMEAIMATGTVKFFGAQKGWGDDGKWLRVTLESPINSDRIRRASAE